MLDPLTILEVHDLLAGVDFAARGIEIPDRNEFLLAHVHSDAVYVARADDGILHGAAFGWPIYSAEDYEGEYVDEPDGTIFYCNMLVVDERRGAHGPAVSATLKRHIQEALPHVRWFCYHRAKHSDRLKLYALERLDTDG